MRFQKQIVPFIAVSTLSLKFPVTEGSSAPPSCLHTFPQSPQKHATPPHQPSQNRTIPCPAPSPLPFNERSASFASALSHPLFVGRGSVCAWLALRPCKALGHTRLRHPCLFMNALLALRPCKAFGRSFQASLPCLPLPLHQTFPPLQPSQKDNNPSLSTMPLPPLEKGEVDCRRAINLKIQLCYAISSTLIYR